MDTVLEYWPVFALISLLLPGAVVMVVMGYLIVRRPDTVELKRLADEIRKIKADNIASYTQINLLYQKNSRQMQVIRSFTEGVRQLIAQLHEMGVTPVWEPDEFLMDWVHLQDESSGFGEDTDWAQLLHLQEQMEAAFNEPELRDIAFRTNVRYEDLSGKRLRDKIRNLLLHLQRRDQIDDLVALCEHLRPNTKWRQRRAPPF